MAETANRSRGSGRRVRGLLPRSTMRVPQPDIIEHFGNADAVPQPPSGACRQAGIVRVALGFAAYFTLNYAACPTGYGQHIWLSDFPKKTLFPIITVPGAASAHPANAVCFAFYSSQGAKPSFCPAPEHGYSPVPSAVRRFQSQRSGPGFRGTAVMVTLLPMVSHSFRMAEGK